MDSFLARRWFAVWLVTGLFVVLSTPDEPDALALPLYVGAVLVFPLGMRARSLHAGPPVNPWRTAIGDWTTGRPTRWLLVAAYAAIAFGVSLSRWDRPWHAVLGAVAAAAGAAVATAPLPWVTPAGAPERD